jgi:prepilin-type N-terminal cleavage/methylation domain-containing protein
MLPPPSRLAFSLVELSIVLVILGLLVGGVLSGQSLIRAAELRSVSTEYNRYYTATQSFRDKYFALPGDMANATAFWGKDNTACAAHTGNAATPGACNGNADGQINQPLAASATGEAFQFWKQLALAGLIEGSYSGLAGAVGPFDTVMGENAPRSKLSNAGWGLSFLGTRTGDAAYHDGNYGHILAFGTNINENDWINNPVMRGEEAWNIDTKIDDGMPHQGTVRTFKNAIRPACVVVANNAYDLTNRTIGCNIWVSTSF